MEVKEGDLSEVAGVVKSTVTDESVTIGGTFLGKVDPCLLADPFVVSGWVKKELGAPPSVKVTQSVLVIIIGVSLGQREQVLCTKQIGTRCDLSCPQEKGSIEKRDYWASGNCESGPTEGKDDLCLRCSSFGFDADRVA
jgi:hypothetical protein